MSLTSNRNNSADLTQISNIQYQIPMKRITIAALILLLANQLHAQYHFPSEEKYKLKNKMQVIFLEYGNVPVTDMAFFVNTGKKNEIPGMQSLASLTSQALLLGNQSYNRIQQDSLKYVMGASLSSSSNDNYSAVSMQFVNKDADKAMDLLAGVMLRPLFPKDEVGEMVHEILTYNSPAKMNANQLAAVYSRYVVFGAGNPLGRHFYATQLNKINADQIREFYKFNYTPKNCVLVVSGKPDKEKMKALIEKYFGNWEASYGEVNGVSLQQPEFDKKEYSFVNRDNGTQAALQWTKKAPEVNSKDQLAFELANEVFSLMLNKAIREKEGKTYGIYSSFSDDNNNGTYAVATQVRNEVMFATTQSFDRVLKQFYDSGAPQEMLDIAKTRIKSGLYGAESPGQIVGIFNPFLYPDFEKRKQYLLEADKIDLAKVNKVVKKYFTPTSYKLVIAGNEKDLAPQLSQIPGLVKLPLNVIEVDDLK
jgi:zinc protease